MDVVRIIRLVADKYEEHYAGTDLEWRRLGGQ